MKCSQITRIVMGYCFVVMSQQLQAQSAEIDSLFNSEVQQFAFNGNVLITEKGKIVYDHSFGYADVEGARLLNENSCFHLASVSKTITSTVILQLKDKGKLRLDDPVIKYLPDFPYPAITIRHLLSHTSGLPDFQIFEALHREDTGRIFSNEDLIPALKRYDRPMPAPGEKWSYSNTGYALLALVVERISGMTFPAYLEKYIFKPAGMQHTYVQTSLLPVNDTGRTVNYDFPSYNPSRLKRVSSMPHLRIPSVILGGIYGPGNVVSNTGDLLRFDEALYNGKLLKPATLEEAFTPARLNNGEKAAMGWGNGVSWYGLGWQILQDSSMGKVVWHTGGAPGMVTVFMRNLTRRQTVIVLDNVTHRKVHEDGMNTLYLLNKKQLPSPGKSSLAAIYVKALLKDGAEHAITVFNDLKSDTAHYYLDEMEMNIRGLEMLFDGQQQAGVEVLRLNTLLFPLSWNVYDSYAEALSFTGKKEDAVIMYRKSIRMNPDNKGGKEALEKIIAARSK